MPKLIGDSVVPTNLILDYTAPAPAQNVWNTAFIGINVEFYALAMGVVTNNETLEIRITLDGNVWILAAGIAVVAGQWSGLLGARPSAFPALNLNMGASGATFDVTGAIWLPWLKGRNILIEVRKTTVVGASDLRVVGMYGRIP